jgi:hypothetical protein
LERDPPETVFFEIPATNVTVRAGELMLLEVLPYLREYFVLPEKPTPLVDRDGVPHHGNAGIVRRKRE